MKKIILSFLVLLFIGCNKDELDEYPKLIEPVLIGNGSLHGNGSEGITQSNQIILNQTDWVNLITQLDSYNNVSNNFSNLNLDFSQFIIIAVFDEVRENGGHSIDIVEVMENKTNITIKIEKLQTGGGSSVITQPFYIVEIPRTKKPIVFE